MVQRCGALQRRALWAVLLALTLTAHVSRTGIAALRLRNRQSAFALPGHQVDVNVGSRTALRFQRGSEQPDSPARARGSARAGRCATQASQGEEEAAAPEALQSRLRVTALSSTGTCFLLEMGGQRILVNPNLQEAPEIPPERVHELVDYVVITSAKDDCLHGPTLSKMNLAKCNFVVSAAAGEALSRLMVRNLAVLASGPGGRVLLEGEKGSAQIAAIVTPGAPSMPWETEEMGFLFVNVETGVALGYEARGQFLGPGASSNREGIPEEAYQVDYLVTSDMRETAGVVKGLASRGASLRGVVVLPSPQAAAAAAAEENPVMNALLAQDRLIGSVLGEVNTPEEFQALLKEEGAADSRLYEPTVAGGALELE